jgi:preprotein translocase subunit SecF
MFVVTYRKIFYVISVILVAGSLVAVAVYGLNFGIDFKGGSILEVEYPAGRPTQVALEGALAPLELKASVRSTGETGYIIRMKSLSEPERVSLNQVVSFNGTQNIVEKRFDSVGPLLGNESAKKSFASIAIVIIAIVLFIAFAFRKVSEPVSSWKYGIIAIVALIHDVIVPTGVFAVLGHFKGYEIDSLFVTALLVVLGFSVHDTIVVFDRVRENLKINRTYGKKQTFEQIVGNSISQTFTRSINTSLTVFLSLMALYFVGGPATQHFTLALIIGIVAGTYSSIFLGSPLLVTIEKWQNRGK